MANIMVTEICNLKCPYCFASDILSCRHDEISIENFKKALEFVTRTDSHVGIIGGEPLTHSKINEILDIIIKEPKIKSCTLYTNGINLSKVETQLINPKFGVLVNFNNDSILGDKRKEMIFESLDRLHNIYYKGDAITLGINMYEPNFKYDYIIDACKRYGKQTVRTSVCVPNSDKYRNKSSLEWFELMKPSVLEFFKAVVTEGIVPNYDCNSMPSCVLDDEEKDWVLKVGELARLNGLHTNINSMCSNCSPVIDILQDLSVVRCFGMSQDLQLSIEDFNNLYDLNSFIDNKVDCFKFLVTADVKCKDCEHSLTQKCTGGCLAYKASKIAKAYDLVKTIE